MTINAANIAAGDQIEAASVHAERIVRRAADWAGWHTRDVAGPVVLAMLRRWVAEPLRLCPHLRGPAPAVGLASRPGQVYCGPCGITTARALRGTAEDDVCDGCRRYAPGDISPGATVLGPISVSHGLCSACLSDEQDALH